MLLLGGAGILAAVGLGAVFVLGGETAAAAVPDAAPLAAIAAAPDAAIAVATEPDAATATVVPDAAPVAAASARARSLPCAAPTPA